MSPLRFSVFAILVFLALLTDAPIASAVMPGDGRPAAQLVRGQNYSKSELLVKFRGSAGDAQIQALTMQSGAVETRRFGHGGRLRAGAIDQWRLVKLGAGADPHRTRAALLSSRQVERVEYNYQVHIQFTPNDPGFPNLWGMHNTGQTLGTMDADIDAVEAWDQHTGDGSVVVAVIDTGVAYDHEDLRDNMWVNTGEVPGNGLDDDGNGYVDDVYGYNFYNNTPNPYDDHGHGTHCAGTIAARGNNTVGVAGVNWQARIMAVKFLGPTGGGDTAGAINAVLYAAANGAKVLSNSWGGGGFSQALLDAIRAADQAGALFVAAAGNSGLNTDITPNYPSNYDVPNVISVAATDHNDLKASFSNYGAVTVDLGAPGVSIYSTVPTVGDPCCSNPAGYHFLSGTSMATPHVSGAAAWLFSRYPGISVQQVRDRLLYSTDPVPALAGLTVTGGRLNLNNAAVADDVPPAAVVDLTSTDVGPKSVTLRWTATGDDGYTGNASSYDLRYSYGPINEGNFDQATPATGTPKPGAPGTLETFTVTGLVSDTNYYFALRVRDNVGNGSALSNVPAVRTKGVKIVFQDNMESGPANWTVAGSDGVGGPALWHLSAHRFNSPTTAFYYGIESTLNYSTGARNFGSITSVPISLVGETDAALTFTHFLQTENVSPFDTARVQVSTDGGATWADLYVTAMSTIGMVTYNASLAAYDGQVILLRFSFDTFDSVANFFEGWVVDDVAVTVTKPNSVPVANAGGPYSGFKNQAIVFNGAASADADGDPLTYRWEFGDGGTGTGPAPSHAYAGAGAYTVRLIVNDGLVDSTPASATVTVENRAPTASAGGPYSGNVGQSLSFNGSASSDPDGDPLTYRWDFGDGSSGSGPTPVHAYVAAGTYTVTLVVNDGSIDSAPATATATVTATAPVANAGPDQTVRRRANVTLNGTGSYDPDGKIVSYRWRQVSGQSVTLRNANSAIASFRAPQMRGMAPIQLVFELTVTDNSGATAKDQVIITVTR